MINFIITAIIIFIASAISNQVKRKNKLRRQQERHDNPWMEESYESQWNDPSEGETSGGALREYGAEIERYLRGNPEPGLINDERKELVTVATKLPVSKKETVVKLEPEEEQDDVMDRFNIEDAIIFSEIIKPKFDD